MEIVRIISEYKKIKGKMGEKGRFIPPVYPEKGYKRVEATVKIDGVIYTKHIDILK